MKAHYAPTHRFLALLMSIIMLCSSIGIDAIAEAFDVDEVALVDELPAAPAEQPAEEPAPAPAA